MIRSMASALTLSKKYFSVECPDRAIYDAMINTTCGDEATMRMILNFMEAYAPCAIA